MKPIYIVLLIFGIPIIMAGFYGLTDPSVDPITLLIIFGTGILMIFPAFRAIFREVFKRSSSVKKNQEHSNISIEQPHSISQSVIHPSSDQARPSISIEHPRPTSQSVIHPSTEYVSSYTVIDTETTGLSSKDRIVQFCALKVVNHNITNRLQLLIDPKMTIPNRVVEIHGISNELVSGSPAFADVSDQIISFIGSDVIIGHNIPFDMRMLNSELLRCGLPAMQNLTIDTLTMSRLVVNSQNKKLSSICGELGISVDQFHDAGSDCMATYLCYEKMFPFAKVYSSGNFEVNSPHWKEWNRLNRERSQCERMARASSCNPLSISQDNLCGVFEGSNGEKYDVSVSSCTCPDFHDRQKPCKHMYRLVAELRLIK